MALSQSTMFLFLETNSLLKYELMLPEEDQIVNNVEEPLTISNEVNNHATEYSELRKDPKMFFEYTHININVFDYILECVRDKLTLPLHKRCKINSAEEKLFITIRYMASGMSLTDISKRINVTRSTTTRVIRSTLTAIWETLHSVHLEPPTPDEMPAAADKFFTKWQFPNAVGAIGAKFIPIKAMRQRSYAFEKTFRKISLVLTAIVDADFRFLAISMTRDISDKKKCTFDDIFKHVRFRKLPGATSKMPYVILGNETFPLRTHLLRPYNEYSKSVHKHCDNYNNRLLAAREPVNIAFQILTEKFTVFSKPIILELETVGLIARTGCLLYNIVKDIDGDIDPHFRDIKKEDTGCSNLFIVKKKFGKHNNRSKAIAERLRDLFTDYIFQHNL